MIHSIDQDYVGHIMLLDVSAAFDIVEHTITLSKRFGLRDEALNWLQDFLTDRSEAIHNGLVFHRGQSSEYSVMI